MAKEHLNDLLSQYDANVLKTIAREHGLDTKATNKQAVASALAKKLAQREEIERSIGKLAPAERELVALLQRVGGHASTGALKTLLQKKHVVVRPPQRKNQWGIAEPESQEGDPHYRGQPTLEDAAARLLLLGLVFSQGVNSTTRQTISWDVGRSLVIPSEILDVLPPPPPGKTPPAPVPVHIESGSTRSFQRDLARYWSFVRRAGRLDLTSQGYVYKKALIQIAQALGRTETKKLDEKTDPYFYFLRRMLVALGLLEPETYGGIPNPEANVLLPKQAKSFWEHSPAERVQATFKAYLDATSWNELRIPQAAYGQDHRRPAPVELKRARRVVVEHLKRRGAGGWVDLAELLDDIRLGDYDFLFPRKAAANYYYGYGPDYGSPYYQSNNPYGITYNNIGKESEGWDKVEGAIITHIVTGPLRWLGLTDVGFESKDAAEPSAYRLTAMGAWLFGIGAPVAISEEGGRVVVQPNFQIVAMEPLAEDVLMTLDEFTQFEGGDHALSYRLTREAVYRGQRTGWGAARIVDYLEKVTHTPLPQNVRRSLEEWQALHERITFRRDIPVLQAEDALTLDELLGNPALAPKLGRRVGHQVALPVQEPKETLKILQEAGWLPVITPANQTDPPASLVADEHGDVTLLHRTPSVYVYQSIEAFAEPVDAWHSRITPASVAAATQRHMTVPAMLTQLKGVHRGEVPEPLVRRIKAWGKYFGDARLGTLTLVEFRDEKARSELLADPELKPYLTRFDAGDRPLALVRSQALERVQELLAERGVEIHALE
jgi:hypothetical protein